MATNNGKKTKATKSPVRRAAKTTQSKGKTASNDLQKRVEEKAYELFSRRGGRHGGDLLDWTLAQDLIELERKADSFKKLRKASVKPKGLEEEIEKRAYKLYDYRGRSDGNDIFDWSLAEEIAFLKK
jgi:hypothetical protein